MEHIEFRLKYGLDKKTRKSRFINEVEKGLPCNCICPICEQELVAKKGNVRVHHFAHHNGADECKGSRMSMLHKLAQEVIQEECQVMLPAYKGKFVQHDAKLQVFDEVTLEEVCKDEVSRRRPDCIGKVESEGIDIWVEIYCTNPINEERKADIVRRKQYCIEIDFSDLLGTDYTKESVRERLLNKSDDRVWICHPVWDKEEADKEEEERQRKEEEERRRKEAERKALEERERVIEERKRALEEALKKGTFKNIQQEKHEIQVPQFTGNVSEPKETWRISEPKEKHSHAVPDTLRKTEDWVMYAKIIYSEKDVLNTFYDRLRSDYAKVNLANSHPFVQQELYLKVNELLPRTDLIVEVTKTYLQLLLAIWVLDKLNHSQNQKLGKVFVENQEVRNAVFKAVKKIENINPRDISDTLIPKDVENRDTVVQILRICYKNQ